MKSAVLPSHLEAIDGLRGFAIAIVVIYHCWLVYGLDIGVVSRVGFLGVDLFFALSGFCMFFPYARAKFAGAPAPALRSYAIRRAAKILPSYLLALTVFAIALGSNGGSSTIAAILAHLFFVHPFVTSEFQSISGPLWTIGIEVQFYVVFPCVAGFFTRRPVLGALGLVAVAEGYRLLVAATGGDASFFWTNQVVAFLDVFAAGMVAAYVVAWYRARPQTGAPAHRWPTALACGAALAAVAGAWALAHSPAMDSDAAFFVWQTHWRLAIAVIAGTLVTATTLSAPGVVRVVANPVLTLLAVLSYNLYLWHLEVLAFSNRVHLNVVAAVALALAVAALVTYAVERPFLELPKRWERRARAAQRPHVKEATERPAA